MRASGAAGAAADCNGLLVEKKRRREQLAQKLVDGSPVCRYCGDALSGRLVFCQDKTPKCLQAYHRAEAAKLKEAAEAAALSKARQEAFLEGQREAQLANVEVQPDDDQMYCADVESSAQVFHRMTLSGYGDSEFYNRFNELLLDRRVDGWRETTLTLPINLVPATDLLQPFLRACWLDRDDFGYVLLPNGNVWTTHFKSNKFRLAGYDRYEACQYGGTSMESRDSEQRKNIVMFLPWVAWARSFPHELLPANFANSALWAAQMQTELLGAVQKLFDAHAISWDPRWEILYVHVLNQGAGAARFRMHRDVEENSNDYGKGYRLRVYHTVVILLHKGAKRVPGMYVAGAAQVAVYPREMTGHVFNASLFHTTEPVCSDECSGVKLGVFIGIRF